MSTLRVTNLVNASSASNNIVLDDKGNATVANTLAMGSSFKRNKIINGDMRIDQRNSGSSISISTDPTPRNFAVDRFFQSASGGGVYSAQRSTTAPAGFTNSLALTVTTADASIAAGDVYYMCQPIEGYNIADWGFGASGAATITLSFWVRSSVTGTFSGSLRNTGANRAYSFTYTINASNTWEQKSISIAGDTTGTYNTDNSVGIWVAWDLGSGTNFNGTANSWTAGNYLRASSATNWIANSGATFYITGVQLEVGSVATPYERQIYSEQLAQCQRYCFKGTLYDLGRATDATYPSNLLLLPVTMRAAPSFTAANGSFTVNSGNSGTPGYLFSSPNTVFLYNSANNWTATAFVQFTGFVTAEL